MRRLKAALFSTLLLLSSTPALAAPTKEQCIASFDQGQTARRAGQLKKSRESLLVCAQQECPSVLRADCSDVLRQVESALPTIVLRVQDANGVDITDVTVELNGAPLATSIDGRAIQVDPGKLTLVFKKQAQSVTVDVVVAEAEKNRIVKATLGAPKAAVTPKTDPASTLPTGDTARSTAGWAVPVAFAVVGVAGFAIGGVTRLGVGSDADDAKKSCGPTCPESTRDDLSSKLVRANIFLGVGIGGVVAAAVTWFILAPRKQSATTAALLDGAARW